MLWLAHYNWLENRRGKDNEVPKRVWKIAETKTGKIQVVKTKRKGEEKERKKQEEKKQKKESKK